MTTDTQTNTVVQSGLNYL